MSSIEEIRAALTVLLDDIGNLMTKADADATAVDEMRALVARVLADSSRAEAAALAGSLTEAKELFSDVTKTLVDAHAQTLMLVGTL